MQLAFGALGTLCISFLLISLLAAATQSRETLEKKARRPVVGWSTWCTGNQCGEDWCTASEVLSVANELKATGMLGVGFNHILLDDCWGVRNQESHRIEADHDNGFPPTNGAPIRHALVHTVVLRFFTATFTVLFVMYLAVTFLSADFDCNTSQQDSNCNNVASSITQQCPPI